MSQEKVREIFGLIFIYCLCIRVMSDVGSHSELEYIRMMFGYAQGRKRNWCQVW